MADLADITGAMGEFMLKGWILTDQTCSTPGCSVPLMRSPKGHSPEVWFCAKCDGKSSGSDATQTPSQVPKSSETNNSTASSISRTSTPLTEVSNNPDDDDDDFQLPPETEESRRRREQSERASAEIGNRLLKGWAMLGEECPNNSCFGVPLVRPPSNGGEKDPRKVCVICGNTYVVEANVSGRERLVPVNSQVSSNGRAGAVPATATAPPESTNGGKRPVVKEPREEIFAPVPEIQTQAAGFPSQIPVQPPVPSFLAFREASHPGILPIAHDADQALQHSLQALSTKLTRLSSSPTLDPGSIGSTADAISKVIQALGHVKAFRWNEAQAHC